MTVGASDSECRSAEEEVRPLLPICWVVGKAAQQVPAVRRPPCGLHEKPLGYSQGPCSLTEKGHSRQLGRHGLHPRICLSPTSWHQTNSTGPSAQCSPVPWPAAIRSASPSGLTRWLAPACPCTPPRVPHPGSYAMQLSTPHPHSHSKPPPLPQEFYQDGAQQLRFEGKGPNSESLGGLDAPCLRLPLASEVPCQLGEAPPLFLLSAHLPLPEAGP